MMSRRLATRPLVPAVAGTAVARAFAPVAIAWGCETTIGHKPSFPSSSSVLLCQALWLISMLLGFVVNKTQTAVFVAVAAAPVSRIVPHSRAQRARAGGTRLQHALA